MDHLRTRSGRAKRKVEPLPSWDFTQIVPPRRSTIFLQMVKQLHRLGERYVNHILRKMVVA